MAKSDGSGVQYEKIWWGDRYTGTKEELVASGFALADQFPGEPGRGIASCTYFDGKPSGQGSSRGSRQGVGYLQIKRIRGRRYQVDRGITAEERAKRWSEWEAEREAAAKTVAAAQHQAAVLKLLAPTGDSESEETRRDRRLVRPLKEAMAVSSALFQVGEKAQLDDGEEVEILEPYDCFFVDGQWRLGYAAKDSAGERFFYAAGQLHDRQSGVRHLKLLAA
jgi:hypothetical protein